MWLFETYRRNRGGAGYQLEDYKFLKGWKIVFQRLLGTRCTYLYVYVCICTSRWHQQRQHCQLHFSNDIKCCFCGRVERGTCYAAVCRVKLNNDSNLLGNCQRRWIFRLFYLFVYSLTGSDRSLCACAVATASSYHNNWYFAMLFATVQQWCGGVATCNMRTKYLESLRRRWRQQSMLHVNVAAIWRFS